MGKQINNFARDIKDIDQYFYLYKFVGGDVNSI